MVVAADTSCVTIVWWREQTKDQWFAWVAACGTDADRHIGRVRECRPRVAGQPIDQRESIRCRIDEALVGRSKLCRKAFRGLF
jgi:hypothetical protein